MQNSIITETPIQSEIGNQEVVKITSYIIARERDSHTKAFENHLKNLKREYGFDLTKETYNMDEL